MSMDELFDPVGTPDDVPFGFEDAPDTEDAPEGWANVVIGKGTKAVLSESSGNPMITFLFQVIDPEVTNNGKRQFWPIRYYGLLKGRGAGLLKRPLRALGYNPDEWLGNARTLFNQNGTGTSPTDIVTFFNAEIVPELRGLPLRIKVVHEPAVTADGKPRIDEETGEQGINTKAAEFAEIE